MGANESLIIIEQNTSVYDSSSTIKTISSKKCKDVLRLYELVHSNNVEESLLVNLEVNCTYAVVLMNQYVPNHCFSLYRTVNEEEGLKNLEMFSQILMPFIDIYPSIHHTNKLSSVIKLCKAYPSWSADQVAEYLHIKEYVKKEVPTRLVDRKMSKHTQEALELIQKEQPSFARDFLGSTPLHYFTDRRPDLVQSLVSTIDSLHQTGKDCWKGGLDSLTKYTESPIHAAIRLSQESVLKLLLEKGANPFILCGHAYPVHLAIQHESKGCLKILLEHDRTCLNMRDKKYQGSVLHWAKSSEQIDLLATLDEVELDSKNNENETPLHIMVHRKRLSPTISLICHGADINTQGKNGATALHYSVLQDDLDIIRALLFLGADISIRDNDGKTAIEYVTEDSDNYHDILDVFCLFQYDKEETCQSRPFGRQKSRHMLLQRSESILKSKTGKEAVLCLDGGGIRGLILIEVLLALESVTSRPIIELFDWISGTSTGSYLALCIANGRSIRYCQRAYLRLGRSCFVGIRPYPSEVIDCFLLSEFGEETRMDAIDFPNVILPAVLADRRPAMLHLFRNYNAPYDEHYQMRDARFPRPPVPADQLMWLATRSSSSAPSYFRSTGRYLDGGLIANNPTLDILSEIHKHEKYFKTTTKDDGSKDVTNLKCIVSIGTGRSPLQLLRPIDIYRPSSVWDTPEIVDSLKGFVDLMVDQVVASDDHVVDRARSWCEMTDIDYHRLSPTLSMDVELNESDDRKLLAMLCDVRKYLLRHFNEIKLLGKQLLGEA